MGTVNKGSQQIGWKFNTPLEAAYLNTFLAGMSTPGLLSRPKITPGTIATEISQTWTIQPFSLLVEPMDVTSAATDANGQHFIQTLVKITTIENIDVTITPTTCALGFEYTFYPEGSETGVEAWYGDVVALSADDVKSSYKGIIIATVQYFKKGTNSYYSVTTNGADISDALLAAEGWDPRCWLSVQRPNRAYQDGVVRYNRLEVRCHNNDFKDTNAGLFYNQVITGAGGVKKLAARNMLYSFNKTSSEGDNPEGTRGFMPAKYNCFSIQSGVAVDDSDTGLMPKTWVEGEIPIDCGSDFPIEKQSGNIFAIVDATDTMNKSDATSFVNRLNIYPVRHQQYNVYLDNQVLYIK